METCGHPHCSLDDNFVWHCDTCGERVDASVLDARREAETHTAPEPIARHFRALL